MAPASQGALAIPEILELVLPEFCMEWHGDWRAVRLVSHLWRHTVDTVLLRSVHLNVHGWGDRLRVDVEPARGGHYLNCWSLLRARPDLVRRIRRIEGCWINPHNPMCCTKLGSFLASCSNLTSLSLTGTAERGFPVAWSAHNVQFPVLQEFALIVGMSEERKLYPHDDPHADAFTKAMLASPRLQHVTIWLQTAPGISEEDSVQLSTFRLHDLLGGLQDSLVELQLIDAHDHDRESLRWDLDSLSSLLRTFVELKRLGLWSTSIFEGGRFLDAIPSQLQVLSVAARKPIIQEVLYALHNAHNLPYLTRVPSLAVTVGSPRDIPVDVVEQAITSMISRKHARYIDAGAAELRKALLPI